MTAALTIAIVLVCDCRVVGRLDRLHDGLPCWGLASCCLLDCPSVPDGSRGTGGGGRFGAADSCLFVKIMGSKLRRMIISQTRLESMPVSSTHCHTPYSRLDSIQVRSSSDSYSLALSGSPSSPKPRRRSWLVALLRLLPRPG